MHCSTRKRGEAIKETPTTKGVVETQEEMMAASAHMLVRVRSLLNLLASLENTMKRKQDNDTIQWLDNKVI